MKLGITTIQQDRGPWIKEWVAFHYLVGFRKFYFFAHNCKDNTNEILTDLKKHFDIKIFTLKSESDTLALECFQYSYDNFGTKVDWMAYVDGDEFLFPTSCTSMKDALKEFENKQSFSTSKQSFSTSKQSFSMSKKLSALGVYWSCFGSSGHIKEPSGLIIENYKHRANLNYHNNRHIKSIVRGGQRCVKVSGTHTFITPFGTYDEALRPITYGLTNYRPTYKKFRINHYICQSRSFYLNWKKKSGFIDSDDNRFSVRDEDWWKEYDRNKVLDNSMDKFIEPLKKLLDSI